MASITRLGQYGGPAAAMSESVYADYGEGPSAAGVVDTGDMTYKRNRAARAARMLIPFALLMWAGCISPFDTELVIGPRHALWEPVCVDATEPLPDGMRCAPQPATISIVIVNPNPVD